jgi:DNA repair exonuclease SbcCD ATPase subunit
MNGIVGLFGANRTGKSSFVGAIMYSLFNTTDRGSISNLHVCNARKYTCDSRVILEHAGTAYVIERKTTKSTNKKGVVSATTDLDFYRVGDNDEVVILNGEARPDTEKIIRNLFGTSDDFLMTSLSAQRDVNSELVSLGSSKRASVLSRFLDLDIFEKMHAIVSKDVNGLKAQLRNFPERDWEALIDAKEEEAALSKQTMDDLALKVKTHQTELDTLRAQFSAISSTAVITQADVDAQAARVAQIEKEIDRCKREQEAAAAEEDSLRAKLAKAASIANEDDISELKKRLDAQSSLESALLSLTHALDKETTSQATQKKVLRILEEVPCGDEFPTCKFIKDAHAAKADSAEQDARVAEAARKVAAAQKKLADSQEAGLKEKIARNEKATALIAKIKLELARLEVEAERRKSTCGDCTQKLSAEKDKLGRLEESLKNSENAEAVTIRRNIEEFSKKIAQWDREKVVAAQAHGKALAQAEHLRDEKKARDAILRDLRVREIVANAFSKKGIPLAITQSQLPVINAEVARILHNIDNFTIELQNDDASDTIEVYINYGDSRRIAELCSGMEKTIASIALRVALINVSTMPKSDIFIIDEGFGTLDPAGVEACNRLLTSLKKYFRTIVVITHVDGIKDVVDHIIEIGKVEKDAKVVYP